MQNELKEKMQEVLDFAESEVEQKAEVRVLRRAVAGETVIHQGDVYLHAVPKDHKRGKPIGTRQVAVGNTIGSRHIAEGEGVTVHEGAKLPPAFKKPDWAKDFRQDQIERIFLGPLVSVDEGSTMTLTHPEHAYHKVTDSSVDWQVTYQGDPRTAARVAD